MAAALVGSSGPKGRRGRVSAFDGGRRATSARRLNEARLRLEQGRLRLMERFWDGGGGLRSFPRGAAPSTFARHHERLSAHPLAGRRHAGGHRGVALIAVYTEAREAHAPR